LTGRAILLVTHTGRPAALAAGRHVATRLAAAGLDVHVIETEAAELDCPHVVAVPASNAGAGVELALVVGGDGTLLRAADLVHACAAPLLGVNLGRVGFLAEAEQEDLDVVVNRVLDRDYRVEERMTLAVTARLDGQLLVEQWALNDVSVEKASRERMVYLVVEVDGRPLSRWGCDGVVFASPTGSTAYAFSAGGPVVWPQVEALLLVPISAHALFARPLVVSPSSLLAVELVESEARAVLFCDGRRSTELPTGTRVEVRRGEQPVRLARLGGAPFTDRLVAKFQLPVHGWHGGARRPG
jgi:NAD+ kinase